MNLEDKTRWTLIVVVFMVWIVGNGCSGVPYSSRDKLALGVFIGSGVADYQTTVHALDRGARELNPIVGENPSNESVALLKLGQLAILFTLGEIWPDSREEFYYVGSVINGAAAIHNSKVK